MSGPSVSKLVEAIADCRSAGREIRIVGSHSKREWLPQLRDDQDLLHMREFGSGIIDYQPEELVLTAYAGTSIKDLQAELAAQGQQFAFEPPQFQGGGTLGGMIASGFSGPARKWMGSVRDAVLGVELVNGKAEHLRFGGQVMKNVAGYDVSRLLAGSFGSLAAIHAASVRVHPCSTVTVTVSLTLDLEQAIEFCSSLRRQYLPLTGTWWCDGLLHLRLSGTQAGVAAAQAKLGGQVIEDAQFWCEVRDHSHQFFSGRAGAELFRVIVPPASGPLHQCEDQSFEWGGGLRWIWHTDSQAVQQWAKQHGGWCWQVGEPIHIEASHLKLMQALKYSFDPDHLFFDMFSQSQASAEVEDAGSDSAEEVTGD